MIQIYHTIIDQSEIIGIGPLMRKHPGDPTLYAMYKQTQFEFQVYTKANCITISTDWLSLTAPDKEANKAEYEQIKAVWERLRNGLLTGTDLSLIFHDSDMPV